MVNIMDQKRCPGNFLLDAASTGLGVVAAISYLGDNYRVKRIAGSFSFSVGLLSEVGREVNSNETLFKDNFEPKFSGALVKCKKQYDQIAAALQKVHTWKKGETDEKAEAMPKNAWKKLAWGLGMTEREFSDFEDEIEESREVAFMVQFVVQLVILQVNAQKRELSSHEQLSLVRVKKEMGDILEMLHKLGVGNVMMFSLQEPTKPANMTQVAQAVDKEKLDDDARSTSSRTIRNPTEISIPAPMPLRKGLHNPGVVPPPPPPYKVPDIYEMHRISIGPREKASKQTLFRFLGIPVEMNRTETNVFIAFDKIPMPQNDIKAFLERHTDAKAKQTIIETLLELPTPTSSAIAAHLNTKYPPRKTSDPRVWTIECVIPAPIKESKARRFLSKKTQIDISHLVIFKGEGIRPPPGFSSPPPGFSPPPPPGYPRPVQYMPSPGRLASIASRKHPKPAAEFELSQQEVENVINDYLASFSTLYDGVPIEQRGAALKAIVLPAQGDSDYDSSSSCSSSWRSLVDD